MNKSKSLTYHAILSILLLNLLKLNSQSINTELYEYISPVPGSDYILPENNIIIRFGEELTKEIDSSKLIIDVSGSMSGHVKGNLFVYKDNKTLIFLPEKSYQRGERVNVRYIGGLETINMNILPELEFYFDIKDPLPISVEKKKPPKPVSSKIQIADSIRKMQTEKHLPENFLPVTTNVLSKISEGKYLFSTNGFGWNQEEKLYPYLIVSDEHGTPVFFREKPAGAIPVNINNKGYITYFDPGSKGFLICDNEFNPIQHVTTGNGYNPDVHDLAIYNNTFWIISYDTQLIDLTDSIEGGFHHQRMAGVIIQNIDKEGIVFFQWRSWDHFSMFDSYYEEFLDSTHNYDLVHANTIEVDSDTSILVSCRNMNEITKINTLTGEIVWRLGGKNNHFEFIDSPRRFSFQHDVRKHDENIITLFDNGNMSKPTQSSSVTYKINEDKLTVEEVSRLELGPAQMSWSMGNSQLLDNGNTVVGWGSKRYPNITEFNSDGEPLIHINFNCPNYRAFKFDWETQLFETDIKEYDFGVLEKGNSHNLNIVINNNQDVPMEISSIHNHLDEYSILEDLPLQIEAKGSREITIKLNPDSVGKAYDVFTLDYDNDSTRYARQIRLTADVIPQQGNSTISYNPVNMSKNILLSTKPVLSFSRALKTKKDELWPVNIGDYFFLRKDSPEGDNIEFKATVDWRKTKVTIASVDELEKASVYYFGIKDTLYDYSGDPILPQSVLFYTLGYTDIEDIKNSEVSISPNPANEFITINSIDEAISEVELITISGNSLIHRKNLSINKIRLNIYDLVRGMYFVKIRTLNNTFATKLIVE